MKSKDNQAHANDDPDSKGHGKKPTYDWRDIVNRTFHDLFNRSWAQNFIIGTALFCIGPLVLFLFMGNLRGMLIGAGIGVTILFWVAWCSLVKHVAPSSSSERSPKPVESPASLSVRDSPEELKVLIGKGGFMVTKEQLKKAKVIPLPPLNRTAVFALKLDSNDNLLVDAIILQENGVKKIYVQDGELHYRHPAWDTNWSDTAFEVVNENREPVFQLRYTDAAKTTIQITGFFIIDGTFLGIESNKRRLSTKMEDFADFKISPIFKYPSRDFRGVYADAP